jgi:hypothetical protein
MPKVTINDSKGLFQESGSGLTVNSAATLTGVTSMTGAARLSSLVMESETVANAGAISPSVPVSLMTCSTGTPAPALADGTYVGQLKHCICTNADGTSQTITPDTTLGSWANVVLAVVGQSATFVWTASGWAVVNRFSGVAQSSATAPAGLPVIG